MRRPVLVDGRIFTVQKKGGISQLWANVLASSEWRDRLKTVLLVYPGYRKNLHLQESGVLGADGIQLEQCPIPPSDNESWAQQEHDLRRKEFTQKLGHRFNVVVNTYYGENVFPECPRYLITGLDFAHEELPELAAKPSTAGVLRRKRIAFEQASWACFISNASRQRFFVHYPQFDRRHTSVIYLGHDPSMPQVPRSRHTVLHVGNRGLYKNFAIVAEAMRKLMQENSRVRLLLLGGEKADATVNALRKEFPGRMIFDSQPSDTAMDVAMATSWIYVSASRYEGFGIPLLNAVRMGAAPVVSDIPVYREIGGDHAQYFDPSSALALLSALRKALVSKAAKHQIWRTWDDVAAEYASLLCHD